MLVGFAEGLGAAKTYAVSAGYDVDSNRELLGLGVANLGSGLASGMVVNGSLSKTAVNGGAGARSSSPESPLSCSRWSRCCSSPASSSSSRRRRSRQS